jgi:FMN phosphatase YigB (HAD superfamily)
VGPLAILFDLDDTLLANPMDTFVPAYFRELTEFMAGELPPDLLIDQLLRATRAMDDNDDPVQSNEQAFAEAFFPGLGRIRASWSVLRFYSDAFLSCGPDRAGARRRRGR